MLIGGVNYSFEEQPDLAFNVSIVGCFYVYLSIVLYMHEETILSIISAGTLIDALFGV